MHAIRNLVLIEKDTGLTLWEELPWKPLTEMSAREILFFFSDPLNLVARDRFVSGEVYFMWR